MIARRGGLHRFMSWDRPILTDSGGYQVFSLGDRCVLTEEGARFRSHLDGSAHLLTPESAVDIQARLGSDIAMVLDECTPYPVPHDEARRSLERTRALGPARARPVSPGSSQGDGTGSETVPKPGPGAVRDRAGQRLPGFARGERRRAPSPSASRATPSAASASASPST